MFITCNKQPDYEDEQENIDRRIQVFPTCALPTTQKDPSAPKWIRDNAMQCLVWMANELNKNVDMLPQEERFYEKPTHDINTTLGENVFPEEETAKLRALNIPDVISQVEVEVSYGVDDSVLSSDFENILDSSATSNAQEPLVVALSPVKENQLSNYPTWIENYEVEDCMQLSSCYNTQESEVDDCNNMPQKLSVETLNTVPYMREVRRIIANYMDQGKDLRCENITNFQLKFDRVGGITYKRADPSFDAWMCVRGKKRNVFQPELLVQRYPSLIETTKDMRKICNVRPSASTNDIVHVKPPP